jgi:hypothetical protein
MLNENEEDSPVVRCDTPEKKGPPIIYSKELIDIPIEIKQTLKFNRER